MVFEAAFDYLVKYIRCNQLIDVRTRKIICERLGLEVSNW
jgi:hypothetical protein